MSLFLVKIFMHSTFTCTMNQLKPCIFQSSTDVGCSVELRHPMNSIFKPEEDLNYFDQFMPLLKENWIFEISSISYIFHSVMLPTWMDLKTQTD